MANWSWHPAQALSLVHHRDIATALQLALTGALNGHTMDVVNEAPTTIYEIARIGGVPSSPPPNRSPMGRTDGTLLRRLGFTATTVTTYQFQREGLLLGAVMRVHGGPITDVHHQRPRRGQNPGSQPP